MKKLKSCFLTILSITFCTVSCSQNYAPGYDFALFEHSPAFNLAKAVEADDSVAIRRILEKEPLLAEFRDSTFGNTVLTLAIGNNKIKAMLELLKLGADPNQRSFNNSSPFLQACYQGIRLADFKENLETLIKCGADVNSIKLDTTKDQFGKNRNYKTDALKILCIFGNLEEVKVLVDHGADLYKYPQNEGSIVTHVLMLEKLDMVKYFLIEKSVPIPEYCVIRQMGTSFERKMTMTDILNEPISSSSKNKKLTQEILLFISTKGMK